MPQCLRIKNNGKQCQRQSSRKSGHSSQFCWQHQKFQGIMIISQPLSSKEINDPLEEKVTDIIDDMQPTSIPDFPPVSTQEPLKPPHPFVEPILKKISHAQLHTDDDDCLQSSKHQCRRLTQLLGLNSFIYFPQIKGKKVLFIGINQNTDELESQKAFHPQTYEVHQWLADLAQNSPQPLDLYIATAHQSPLTPQNQLRFHSIDIRKYLSGNAYLLDPFQMMIVKLLVFKPQMTWSQAENMIRKSCSDLTQLHKKQQKVILSYLFGLNRSHSSLAAVMTFFNDLTKQLQLPIDSQEFNKYLAVYSKNIDKELSKLHNSIDKKKFMTVLMKSHMELSFDLLMDVPINIHFLSRFLVIFDDNTVHSLQKKATRPSDEIKNAIVYSDSHQTDLYAKFMANYYGVKSKINKKQDTVIKNIFDLKYLRFNQPFDFFETEKVKN